MVSPGRVCFTIFGIDIMWYGVLIGIGFIAYMTITKQEVAPALFGYFARPSTHWVPFWGWLRGIS